MTAPQQICQIISSSFSEATFSMAHTHKKKKNWTHESNHHHHHYHISKTLCFVHREADKITFQRVYSFTHVCWGLCSTWKTLKRWGSGRPLTDRAPGLLSTYKPLPTADFWLKLSGCRERWSCKYLFCSLCMSSANVSSLWGGKGNKDFFFPQRCCWAT